MWRTFGIILAALLLSAPSASAQVSWTVTTEVFDKYLAGSLGFRLYDGPVSQTNINASVTKGALEGAYANIWYSGGLVGDRFPSNIRNEVDWTLGWAGTANGMGVDASCSYYDLPKLFKTIGDIRACALEVNTAFVSGKHTLTPFVLGEYISPEGASDGLWLRLGLRDSWNVTDYLTVAHAGRVMYDSGAIDVKAGFNYAHQAMLVWKLSDSADLRLPIVKLHTPITNFGDGRKTEIAVGSGIVVRF